MLTSRNKESGLAAIVYVWDMEAVGPGVEARIAMYACGVEAGHIIYNGDVTHLGAGLGRGSSLSGYRLAS